MPGNIRADRVHQFSFSSVESNEDSMRQSSRLGSECCDAIRNEGRAILWMASCTVRKNEVSEKPTRAASSLTENHSEGAGIDSDLPGVS